MNDETGPGVPEALPRVLRMIGRRLGTEAVDRLWIFPPLVRGRREWGLVAVSRYAEPRPSGDAASPPGVAGGPAARATTAESDATGPLRHVLFTAPYAAERTGKGLFLDASLKEQGEAPPDRLPRVMDGVVRRSGDDLGEAREVAVRGDPERFQALLQEFDPALFEEEARPYQPAEP